jgi:tRNA modification GTPase
MSNEDTIAAIATAIGESSIGIIRVSGDKAIPIAEKISHPWGKKQKWSPFRMYYGHITNRDGSILDEVLLVAMLAPKSYTRENMIEIHAHGGYVAMRRILHLVLDSGRQACGTRRVHQESIFKRSLGLVSSGSRCGYYSSKDGYKP